MRSVGIFLTVLILGMAAVAHADKVKQHPIDKAEETCIDEDGSTAGMANCAEKAYASWDKELNSNYGALMKELPPRDREVLKAAQKKWLEYRDQEFKLIEAVYLHAQGTMYVPIRVGERVAIVKARALKLKDFLEVLKEGR